jgi:hypothetical protein
VSPGAVPDPSGSSGVSLEESADQEQADKAIELERQAAMRRIY